MLRKTVLFISLLLVLCYESLATGPSYIRAEIRPISMTDKGEILCRTRFLKNPSGGRYELDIEYGLCVLIHDTILHFPIDTVSFEQTSDSGSDEYRKRNEVYKRQLDRWESIFQSQFKPLKKGDIDYHPVVKEYGFKEANVSRYKRNDSIFVAEFKRADLRKIPQKALYGAEGVSTTRICIAYDFGNIIVIENAVTDACDGEEFSIGAEFNYINPWGSCDLGYDCQHVTGVVFINE